MSFLLRGSEHMTAKQEKYVQNLIQGMSQRQAYKDAYPNAVKWKDETVDSKASVLLNKGAKGKVLARYKELLKKTEDNAIMNAKERRKWLTMQILNNDNSLSDRLKAMDILNKMDGEYNEKIKITGEINTNPFDSLSVEELKKLIKSA